MSKKVVGLVALNIALVCLVIYLAVTFPPRVEGGFAYNRDISLPTRPLIFTVEEILASDNYRYARKGNSFAGPYKARAYLRSISPDGKSLVLSDEDEPYTSGTKKAVIPNELSVDASAYAAAVKPVSTEDFVPHTKYIFMLKPGLNAPELLDFWQVGTDPDARKKHE